MELKRSSSQKNDSILYMHALAAKDGYERSRRNEHAFERNNRKVKNP